MTDLLVYLAVFARGVWHAMLYRTAWLFTPLYRLPRWLRLPPALLLAALIVGAGHLLCDLVLLALGYHALMGLLEPPQGYRPADDPRLQAEAGQRDDLVRYAQNQEDPPPPAGE